jgi:hypothetical protein
MIEVPLLCASWHRLHLLYFCSWEELTIWRLAVNWKLEFGYFCVCVQQRRMCCLLLGNSGRLG